jgi:uncharacterized membrane protein
MYHLSVLIHILAAIFWIGGMLFTAAVLVPASRHHQSPGPGLYVTQLDDGRILE